MLTVVKHLTNRKSLIKIWLLLQVAQFYAIAKDYIASIRCRGIHQRPHQGCFPCTVFGHNSHLFAFVNTKGDVRIQGFDAIRLTDLMNGKQVFYIQGVKIILLVRRQSKRPWLPVVCLRPTPLGPLVGSRTNSPGPVP